MRKYIFSSTWPLRTSTENSQNICNVRFGPGHTHRIHSDSFAFTIKHTVGYTNGLYFPQDIPQMRSWSSEVISGSYFRVILAESYFRVILTHGTLKNNWLVGLNFADTVDSLTQNKFDKLNLNLINRDLIRASQSLDSSSHMTL
jgi:hypothetical protein